ncbi:MAG TPA: hypothetical protein VMY99_00355 [Nevskiaceae bacterium]|nr:hypothetical protein [Nevskiaceae bacterium]
MTIAPEYVASGNQNMGVTLTSEVVAASFRPDEAELQGMATADTQDRLKSARAYVLERLGVEHAEAALDNPELYYAGLLIGALRTYEDRTILSSAHVGPEDRYTEYLDVLNDNLRPVVQVGVGWCDQEPKIYRARASFKAPSGETRAYNFLLSSATDHRLVVTGEGYKKGQKIEVPVSEMDRYTLLQALGNALIEPQPPEGVDANAIARSFTLKRRFAVTASPGYTALAEATTPYPYYGNSVNYASIGSDQV